MSGLQLPRTRRTKNLHYRTTARLCILCVLCAGDVLRVCCACLRTVDDEVLGPAGEVNAVQRRPAEELQDEVAVRNLPHHQILTKLSQKRPDLAPAPAPR